MGGGDLNLKKSWHPNTMKNMERVWKAEQKDTEEKKRIAELQKEILAERFKEDLQKHGEETGVLKKKDEVKLEWMYKGPSQMVNHEDYLLGKAVDKNFEKQLDQKSLPSTSFGGSMNDVPDVQVDLARKVVEDPLEVIRRRAIEKAKELYNNPVKLKKIQKMVAQQSESKKKHKKEKKEKKKKKKKSKSHKKSSGGINKDTDLDALLTAKLKKVLKDKDILKKLKEGTESSSSGSDLESSSESDSSEKVLESSHKKRDLREEPPKESRKSARQNSPESSKKRRRSLSRDRDRKYHSCSQLSRKDSPENNRGDRGGESSHVGHSNSSKRLQTSYEDQRTKKNYPSSSESEKRRKRQHHSSSSENEKKHPNDDSDDENSSKRKRNFGLMMPDGSKPVSSTHSFTRERKNQVDPKKFSVWERKERVKLTEEEKERKRQEMLANASWRDKEREAAVKQYRQEEDRERNLHERNFDESFAMKQFSKATEQASIEGRIKSKLNTIQRSKVSMDKNFARR